MSSTVRRLGWVWMVCLLVSLTGCSGFTLPSSREPVTVRFAFIDGIADYGTLAEAYEKEHTNITIELIPLDLNNLGADPRIAETDAIRLPIEAVQDEFAAAFLPLDSLIETDRNFPQADLFPGALEALRLDGKQVGLPAGLNPFVINYSQAKFKIAGLEPPSPGWTLEDFILSATSIHDISQPGDVRFTYGLCTSPESPDSVMIAYLFGGGLVDNPYQPTRPTLNSTENLEALTWYASLKNDFGIVPDVRNTGEIYRLRSGIRCGYWMDWMDRAFYMSDGMDDTRMLPLPAYRAPFAAVNMDGYYILNQSEHPDETYAWLRYLMGQQRAAGQLIPPLPKLIQSQDYAGRVNPAVLAIAENLPDQAIILGLEFYRDQQLVQVLELFIQATMQVMSGEVDPATALQNAQQQAESAFR